MATQMLEKMKNEEVERVQQEFERFIKNTEQREIEYEHRDDKRSQIISDLETQVVHLRERI